MKPGVNEARGQGSVGRLANCVAPRQALFDQRVLPVSVRRANLLGDCDHGIGARRDAALAIGRRDVPLDLARRVKTEMIRRSADLSAGLIVGIVVLIVAILFQPAWGSSRSVRAAYLGARPPRKKQRIIGVGTCCQQRSRRGRCCSVLPPECPLIRGKRPVVSYSHHGHDGSKHRPVNHLRGASRQEIGAWPRPLSPPATPLSGSGARRFEAAGFARSLRGWTDDKRGSTTIRRPGPPP